MLEKKRPGIDREQIFYQERIQESEFRIQHELLYDWRMNKGV